MTVAVLGAPSPPAKPQCPRAWSRLLKTSMAAPSLALARAGLSAAAAFAETRYCILAHLLWLAGARRGRPLTPATNNSALIRHRVPGFLSDGSANRGDR